MVEISENGVFDLLSDNEKGKISKSNYQVLSLANTKNISYMDELKQFMRLASKRRLQKSTDQNVCSSRSHVITVIQTAKKDGKILFVDLAGFEHSSGKPSLTETNFINCSLQVLNKCLLSYSKGEKPMCRGTALTEILEAYLNENLIMYFHATAKNARDDLNYIKDVVVSA